MKMRYEKFLKGNLIKNQTPDFKQVSYQLQRSLKDLKTAEANLKIDLTRDDSKNQYVASIQQISQQQPVTQPQEPTPEPSQIT